MPHDDCNLGAQIPTSIVRTDASINTGADWNESMVKRLSNAPWQYKRYLYPKMLPHQKVFVIPPICERTATPGRFLSRLIIYGGADLF